MALVLFVDWLPGETKKHKDLEYTLKKDDDV